jgi:hypothetical protein
MSKQPPLLALSLLVLVLPSWPLDLLLLLLLMPVMVEELVLPPRRGLHDQMALLVEPAAGCVLAALEDDVVALQAASQVVPGRGDQGVLALQVLDFLLGGGLVGGQGAAVLGQLETALKIVFFLLGFLELLWRRN